jgi:hypothetical protein
MAWLGGLLDKGQAKTEEFLRNGVDQWVTEGKIDARRAAELERTLNTPEVEAALLHAGAHFAISLPLRFPFGATARFLYTLVLRVKAEASGLIHRTAPVQARRCHTLLVMLVSLLPGFGRMAYFLSPALAGERLLVVIPLDQVSRKLPFKTYRRLHLDALFVYWAHEEGPRRGFRHFVQGGWLSDLKERTAALQPYGRLIGGVIAVDTAALLIGAYLYLTSGRTIEPGQGTFWWFGERNIMATVDAMQLLAGAFFGVAAYHLFWQVRRSPAPSEAAGIFLWGIGGLGLLLFALDDYLGVHESLGERLQSGLGLLPLPVNMPDDLLIVAYAIVGVAVLYTFRMEVFADRPSATLLQLAALASIVMVLTDAFATTLALMALEYPAQTLANGLLALAFIVRYREVAAFRPALAGDAAGMRTA